MLNLRARAWCALLSLSLICISSTAWADPPLLVLPPAVLFDSSLTPNAQQMDDPELVREMSEEESLVDLQNIEYERDALSHSRGLLLSAIPGAGWSMIYANRKAQGILMIAGSIAGYALGVAYMAGTFDESVEVTCNLNAYDINTQSKASLAVGSEFCRPKSEIHPTNPAATMPYRDTNLLRNYGAPEQTRVIFRTENVPAGYSPPQFNEVREYYQEQTRGQKYDGTTDGQIIIATTYAVTTVLAAVWSWVEINEQNNDLRKRIESTAQGSSPSRNEPVVLEGIRPTFSHTTEETLMGIGGAF